MLNRRKRIFILLSSLVMFLLLFRIECYSQPIIDAATQKNFTKSELNDNTQNGDSTFIIGLPKFYTKSGMLFGVELVDPFHPQEELVTATRIWKTDIRLGISQEFKHGILTFLSIRDMDSPNTNDFNLYEAGVKISHDWGKFWFGQFRIQAGEKSFYLNDAFDKSFWDKGLIYDYLMRGVGTSFNVGTTGKTELFIGSDKNSYFIGGGKYSVSLSHWFKSAVSGLYVARDQEYSAFGSKYGIEFEESFENIKGYQVISYRKLDQEPSPIEVLNFFSELRYISDSRFELGMALLYKNEAEMKSKRAEIRTDIDFQYRVTQTFTPQLRLELFRNFNYEEIHLGFSAYLNYFNHIKIIPRIRYIFTQVGPDMGFIGVEGRLELGKRDYFE